jgi:hypothetical protein
MNPLGLFTWLPYPIMRRRSRFMVSAREFCNDRRYFKEEWT